MRTFVFKAYTSKRNRKLHKQIDIASQIWNHCIALHKRYYRRFGTDHVDLYIIHRFDPETPIEETIEALDSVVRSGKARYIGASSMHAWQFMRMLALQERHGLAKFVSMQNHYNLIYREEEREMLPFCRELGIAVTPWSPLARGLLAGSRKAKTVRATTDQPAHQWEECRRRKSRSPGP